VSWPLTRGATILLIGAALGGPACGGDAGKDRDRASTAVDTPAEAPAPAREPMTAGELSYCVEGAGARTARPGDQGDVEGARRELVIFWADTKHSADIYFSAGDAAAQGALEQLSGQRHVRRDRNVVIVPDADRPPDSVEALLIDDCIP
jgi:hypothetical protein